MRLPDIKTSSEFINWVEELPQIESPLWSGLPLNAERILKEQECLQLLANWRSIQGASDDSVDDVMGAGASGSGGE